MCSKTCVLVSLTTPHPACGCFTCIPPTGEFAASTVITVAHRINTIMDSSRVLVLEMGRLVEFDSPLALLQDHASMFYSLVHKED